MSHTGHKNVLITCAGKWVGMTLQVKRAMAEVSALRDGQLFVADRTPMTPAGYFADAAFEVPDIVSPDYGPTLVSLCERERVRVLVPLIDVDMDRLSPHIEEFRQVGTTLVCPPPHAMDLCFDKVRFEEFAREEGLAHPPIVNADALESLPEAVFPLFMKRRHGFGSIGSGICESLEAALEALQAYPDLLFQEIVRAPEVSVDALIDTDGRCIARVPRLRSKVVGGESQQSGTFRDDAINDLADRTVAALARQGVRGPLNVQMFKTDPPCLIEVNARLGAGSVLSNMATGGRFFASMLAGACGETSGGHPDDYQEGLQMYRFHGDVFHDGRHAIAAFPGPTGPVRAAV